MGEHASDWDKFKTLTKKNWLLQWHKKNQIIIQILVIILVHWFIDIQWKTTKVDKHTYKAFNLSSISTRSDSDIHWNNSNNHMLAFSPNNELLRKIIQRTSDKLDLECCAGFKNAKVLDDKLATKDYFAGVEFDDEMKYLTNYPKDFSFTLRFFTNRKWFTDKIFEGFGHYGSRNPLDEHCNIPIAYHKEGFLDLQNAISLSYIELAGNTEELPNIFMQRFPYPSHRHVENIRFMITLVIFCFLFSVLFPCIFLIGFVAIEKENEMKELLKIMGLDSWIQWAAWFVKSYTILSITFISWLLQLTAISIKGQRVFGHADKSLVLVFLILYGIAIITFCFFTTVLFSRVHLTQLIFLLMYFISMFMIDVIPSSNTPFVFKIPLSLYPNSACVIGLTILFAFEGTGEGARWSNILTPCPGNNISLFHVMIMMFISSFIYMALCLYIEQIFPSKYGVARKWYFPLTLEFWYRKKYRKGAMDNQDILLHSANSSAFEEEPHDKQIGLEIKNFGRKFGSKWVVKNVSLNVYINEITVLLGHNASGKTTLISMLTGLMPASSGTVLINGVDIRKYPDQARCSMGVCLQQNVLYENLSVSEHLNIFCRFKGLKGWEVNVEVEKYLKLMGIDVPNKRKAKNLSTGMKRQLCLCCAMCGGTKVVVCDEPSLSLDPEARHKLWDLLQTEKTGRTFFLTTHFMDEADTLGDRIAIMCDGELKCYASPFFLKKKFTSGYGLICLKQDSCDVDAVTITLQKFIPNIEPESNIGSELTYRLPDSFSAIFPEMFRVLESQSAELGLNGFGLNVASMEEVFMKIGTEDSENYIREEGGESEKGDFNKSTHKLDEQKSVDESSSSSYESFKETSSQGILKMDSSAKADNATETTYRATSDDGQNTSKHFDNVENQRNELIHSNKIQRPLHATKESIRPSEPVINLSKIFFKRKDGINFSGQWEAMFLKKILYTWRNYKMFIALNIFLVLYICVVVKALRTAIILSPITFSLKLYPKVVTVLEAKNPSSFKAIQDEYRKITNLDGINYKMVSTGSMSFEDYILELGETMQVSINKEYLVGATITSENITAWINNQLLHTAPLSLNLVHNAVARSILGPDTTITVTNHPYYDIYSYDFSDKEGPYFSAFMDCMFFLTPFYITFLVEERTSNFKLLQIINGAHIWIFWMTHFIWDFLTYTFSVLLLILAVACFEKPNMSSFLELGSYFLVLLAFGVYILPFIYFLSFFRKYSKNSFVIVIVVNLVTAFFALFCLASETNGLFSLFCSLPFPLLLWSLMDLGSNIYLWSKCSKRTIELLTKPVRCKIYPECCQLEPFFSWKHPGVMMKVITMICAGVIIFSLIVLLDYPFTKRLIVLITNKINSSKKVESTKVSDDDVEAEKTHIDKMSKEELKGQNLVLDRVSKYYSYRFLAVDQISLSVNRYECFGMLGINGAGKTTVFKMMVGEERISQGNIYVQGFSVSNDLHQTNKRIGYCPQLNALLDYFTFRETLRIFCLLRGAPRQSIRTITENLAKALGLFKDMEKITKTYSDGNKRKLSIAIALVGDPSVIFLDEPTSSMDPVARKQLWNILCSIRDFGKTIVLTSHNMEECEALCTSVMILVNGEARCIGSIQHLKNKFSKGFVLLVKLEKDRKEIMKIRRKSENQRLLTGYESNIEHFKEVIMEKYPNAILHKEHSGALTYYIPFDGTKWSEVFEFMEEVRDFLYVEDYSISQTSLEEIFLGFARLQTDDRRKSKKRNKLLRCLNSCC